MKNVLITGGTGLIGRQLSSLLKIQGYQAGFLSRTKNKLKNYFYWNIENDIIDNDAVEWADYVVHLAGENISTKRWTENVKKNILDSRIKGTRLLLDAIKKADKRPEKIVSASAIGYYGTFNSEKNINENDKAGNDFLAETVKLWEEEINKMIEYVNQLAVLRFGVVMSVDGGALVKMIKPVKNFGAIPLGSGKQYIPWISAEDVARLIIFSIENDQMQGTFNAVASNIKNKDLMRLLAKKYHRPYIPVGIPPFILKFIMGKMSSIILYGSRIDNSLIKNKGFAFKNDNFETLKLP